MQTKTVKKFHFLKISPPLARYKTKEFLYASKLEHAKQCPGDVNIL